MFSSK
jgi:hypothetical protein